MKTHLKMLLKAVEVVAKGLLITTIIIFLLFSYLKYANTQYKKQHGWVSHVEFMEGEE